MSYLLTHLGHAVQVGWLVLALAFLVRECRYGWRQVRRARGH